MLMFVCGVASLWLCDSAGGGDAQPIRKLVGQRITLYTDMEGEEIDRLPTVFDQAFPQWCKYFHVDERLHPDWRLTGFLMKDRSRFAAAGFMPNDLPPFPHGFSRGDQFWLFDQPSDFYRRELFLHEGTHGFMNTLLGSCGPPWYMEGTAEYFGTHRLHNGRLTLGYMPRSRDEAPEWGRVKIIQDAVAVGRAMRLDDVLDMPPTAHRVTEPYAWCWAAVTLLDRHPRYKERFRQMAQHVRDPELNGRLRRLFADDWRQLCEEWQLMTADMQYGYDVVRSAVDFTPAKDSLSPNGEGDDTRTITVIADRGWQNSGLRLEAGKTYRLTATGRYTIADDPKPWPCEPGGVSIRYYKGRPLGMLLAAVRPDNPSPGSKSALLRPMEVGLGATIVPDESGTLFLKVNDSPGELHDNAGQLQVKVGRPGSR